MFKACVGLNCVRQIDFIDRRHCSLAIIPDEIYRHAETLEELLLDSNSIQDLPNQFFRLTNLRRLTISDNSIARIPPAIGQLAQLVELDLSKNAIEEIPQNVVLCSKLSVLDCSSNTLLRTPEVLSALTSLTQLCMNDTAITRLPLEIGNLQNLVVLEARENLLKSVPVLKSQFSKGLLSFCHQLSQLYNQHIVGSIYGLKNLSRLDLGNNEIEELPEQIGELKELTEIWLDTNALTALPEAVTKLCKLEILDVTENKLGALPDNLSSLKALTDLHASKNALEKLPDDIGDLSCLTLLKLDGNHLSYLPSSIGRLSNLVELLLFDNMLETIPESLFDMKSLQLLNLDKNHLVDIPASVGRCKSLHVLTLRENELIELPEEIGELEELTVLDIAGNKLTYLPISLSNLKNLDALWIDGSQLQPLISLRAESDPQCPEKKRLTCSYLPQQGEVESVEDNESDTMSDTTSTRSNSISRGPRLGVAFDPNFVRGDSDTTSKLVRFPTPSRKQMKAKRKKYKPYALPATPIFKKGNSQDDLTLFSTISAVPEQPLPSPVAAEPVASSLLVSTNAENKSLVLNSSQDTQEIAEPKAVEHRIGDHKQRSGSEESDSAAVMDIVQEPPSSDVSGSGNVVTDELMKTAVYATDQAQIAGKSHLQTIEVVVELRKLPNRSLGFSIAGGKGSTPAYEDVDESIFITKIAAGGLAEQDGRLRLGDKLLSVNDHDMTNSTHHDAVGLLKEITDICNLVVSREVLVVMPEDLPSVAEQSMIQPVSDNRPDDSLCSESQLGDVENPTKPVVHDVLDASSLCSDKIEDIEGRKSSSPVASKKAPYENYVNIENMSRLLRSTSPPGSVTDQRVSQLDEQMKSKMLDEDTDEEYPDEVVVLDRRIGSLGLSIVGGSDHTSRVFGQGRPGIYISKITQGGAAAATGKLKIGDRILQVNGMDLRHATHQEAVQWLVQQRGDIELIVRHVPPPLGLKEIELIRGENEKLGISIKGGAKGSMGNPLDPEDEGIFISKITPGGSAERNGDVKVGQRLLEVNGTTLLGASHAEAVAALRGAPERLHLLVCFGYDPVEVENKKKVETEVKEPANEVKERMVQTGETLHKNSTMSLSKVQDPVPLKLVHSQSLIEVYDKPVTADDLDAVLSGLAQFKLEGTQAPLLESMSIHSVADIASATELMNTKLELEMFGTSQRATSLHDFEALEQAAAIQEELDSIDIKDSTAVLAALDVEVLHLQDEVNKQENELEEGRRNRKKRRSPSPSNPDIHVQPPSPVKKATVVDTNVEKAAMSEEPMVAAVVPSVVQPAVNQQSVQSMIVELFGELSPDNFEIQAEPLEDKDDSPPNSRGITPTNDTSRTGTPVQPLQELLRALQSLGENEQSSSGVPAPAPSFPSIGYRGSTKAAPLQNEDSNNGTSLDNNTRPPKVTQETDEVIIVPKSIQNNETSVGDHPYEKPEVLSFRDKLALHKKVAGELDMAAARPRSTIITDDLLNLRRKEFGTTSARPHSAIITDNALSQHRRPIVELGMTPSDELCSTIVTVNVTTSSSEVCTRDCHSGEVLNQDNRNNNCSRDDNNRSSYIASVLSSQPKSTLQIPDDADIPQTEEHLKRKAWRDKMTAALNDQVLQAELAISECKSQGLLSPATRSTVPDEQGQHSTVVQDAATPSLELYVKVHQKAEDQALVSDSKLHCVDTQGCDTDISLRV